MLAGRVVGCVLVVLWWRMRVPVLPVRQQGSRITGSIQSLCHFGWSHRRGMPDRDRLIADIDMDRFHPRNLPQPVLNGGGAARAGDGRGVEEGFNDNLPII